MLFVFLFCRFSQLGESSPCQDRSYPVDPFISAVSCRPTLLNPREHGRHTCYAIQPCGRGLSFALPPNRPSPIPRVNFHCARDTLAPDSMSESPLPFRDSPHYTIADAPRSRGLIDFSERRKNTVRLGWERPRGEENRRPRRRRRRSWEQLNAHSEQLNATMCRQGTVAFTLTSHQKYT